MSKTVLYLVILAILGFGVWFFLFSDKSGELLRSSDSKFTIRDTSQIGKIFLSNNGSGKSVLIERKENGWIVDKKYPVLQSMLRNLLVTLHDQQALYPSPAESREGIIRNLAGSGIKVEVYDRSGEKMRSFYVGGELARFAGTSMLMEGSERPYVVNVPGFEGYLTPKYLPDLRYWRDRIVFDIAPEQITRVNVRYAQEPLNSFTLTQQGGRVTVALDSSIKLGEPLNETRARTYLKFFTKVYSEGFLVDIPELDSIIRSMPQKGVIEVDGGNGYHQVANIIYYPRSEHDIETTPHPDRFEEQFSGDRYFAVINGGADTVSVPMTSFEKIFRRGYEFFTPDNSNNGQLAFPGVGNGISTDKK